VTRARGTSRTVVGRPPRWIPTGLNGYQRPDGLHIDDTAVECWRIVDPVLAAWRDDAVPLLEYPAGSTARGD